MQRRISHKRGNHFELIGYTSFRSDKCDVSFQRSFSSVFGNPSRHPTRISVMEQLSKPPPPHERYVARSFGENIFKHHQETLGNRPVTNDENPLVEKFRQKEAANTSSHPFPCIPQRLAAIGSERNRIRRLIMLSPRLLIRRSYKISIVSFTKPFQISSRYMIVKSHKRDISRFLSRDRNPQRQFEKNYFLEVRSAPVQPHAALVRSTDQKTSVGYSPPQAFPLIRAEGK
jgi:hypothetical protein